MILIEQGVLCKVYLVFLQVHPESTLSNECQVHFHLHSCVLSPSMPSSGREIDGPRSCHGHGGHGIHPPPSGRVASDLTLGKGSESGFRVRDPHVSSVCHLGRAGSTLPARASHSIQSLGPTVPQSG